MTGAVACGTVDTTAVVEYLDSLDRLRAGTQSVDADLAARFESLITANSGDASAYAALYKDVRSSNAELLARLRGLRPPDILADHHADLVGGLTDLIDGVDEVIAAIEGRRSAGGQPDVSARGVALRNPAGRGNLADASRRAQRGGAPMSDARPPIFVSAGEVMVELGSTDPVARAERFWRSYSGDVLNIAVAIRRLGLPTSMLTKLGEDPFGDYLLAEWQKLGVDLRYVSRGGGPTGLYFAEFAPDSHYDIWYYRKGSAASTIAPADIDALSLGGNPAGPPERDLAGDLGLIAGGHPAAGRARDGSVDRYLVRYELPAANLAAGGGARGRRARGAAAHGSGVPRGSGRISNLVG